MRKQIITESEKFRMQKLAGIVNEENYSDYLDTNYDADGMDDHYAEKALYEKVEKLYDIGEKLYSLGKHEEAKKYRQEALAFAQGTDWGEEELPPYE